MNKTFIIAEAGVNHNGKVSIAKRLIDNAKYAGADAIKFQTFIPDQLTTVNAKTAKYQSKKSISQQSLLKKLNLKFKDFIVLKKYCKKKNIFFLLSLIHISEPTRRTPISYAVFCLKKCGWDSRTCFLWYFC